MMLTHDLNKPMVINSFKHIALGLDRRHGFGRDHGIDHGLLDGLDHRAIDVIEIMIVDKVQRVSSRLLSVPAGPIKIVSGGKGQKYIAGGIPAGDLDDGAAPSRRR